MAEAETVQERLTPEEAAKHLMDWLELDVSIVEHGGFSEELRYAAEHNIAETIRMIQKDSADLIEDRDEAREKAIRDVVLVLEEHRDQYETRTTSSQTPVSRAVELMINDVRALLSGAKS